MLQVLRCANVHHLAAVGAHPLKWLEMLINWENQHLQFALPKLGQPDAAPYFGSDFVVIVIDAHNGLQLGNNYSGLSFMCPSGKTMYQEYCAFTELFHFSQVLYAYSDCSERFHMDSRLDEKARACAVIARRYGLSPLSLAPFWETIKPLCLGMESSGRSLTCWRHTDYGQQYKLKYFWDQFVKKC